MMLTRIHIASFIGLTIIVWLIALWIQGEAVLSVDFLRPFGLVVGTIAIVVGIFSKWAWAWPVFRGWYVKRPDIRGTWRAELQSNWIDPETGKPKFKDVNSDGRIDFRDSKGIFQGIADNVNRAIGYRIILYILGRSFIGKDSIKFLQSRLCKLSPMKPLCYDSR